MAERRKSMRSEREEEEEEEALRAHEEEGRIAFRLANSDERRERATLAEFYLVAAPSAVA